MPSQINEISAQQLAEKIKNKELTSQELVQYYIDRIETVNPALNAVVVKRYEQAIKEAAEADSLIAKGISKGRLHGVPFTIKECFDLVNTPSTFGLLRRKNDFPPTDDPYVAKLRKEGGIVLGKTNVAQLLMYHESDNPVYGRTNNPHNLAFACGGSSGGEGAIVAAKASPFGIGTDIGGSVRIPAAFCGTMGIKPTYNRTIDLTRFLDVPFQPPINSVVGPIANHVEDLELVLQMLNEVNNNTTIANLPIGDSSKVDISRLKIGYFLSDGLFEPMSAVKRAVLESVEKLKGMGATVVEFEPLSLAFAEEIFFRLLSAETEYGNIFLTNLGKEKAMPQAAGLVMISKASPTLRSILRGVSGLLGQQSLRRLIPYFGGSGDAYLNHWVQELHNYRLNFDKKMNAHSAGPLDALLCPPSALPAFLHNTADKLGLAGMYAPIFNVTGYPAGVVPVSAVRADEAISRKTSADLSLKTAAKVEKRSAGMPLSVQVAAKYWDEHIVLAIMKALR